MGLVLLKEGQAPKSAYVFFPAVVRALTRGRRNSVSDLTSIELGRACASEGFRTGRVMYALWRGLTSYLLRNEKRYYFGCSSLTRQIECSIWDSYVTFERS